MIGEHGDSQLPVWSAVNIAGMQFDEFCAVHNITVDKDTIVQDVKRAGSEVIKRKGATYYAIALSINRIVEALLKDQNSILTVGTVVDGEYGLDGMAVNLPCIVSKNGIEKVLNIRFDENEMEALRYSAEQIKTIIDEVKDL
jgi:L-lactate dehydrogenase